jgi:hypothetical protein
MALSQLQSFGLAVFQRTGAVDKVDCLASTAIKYRASSLATWQHRESRGDVIEVQVELLC